MCGQPPAPHQTMQRLRAGFSRGVMRARKLRAAKHQAIYHHGDRGETVFFIHNGSVKLVAISPEGRECLLAIYTAGDIFGESCLAGFTERRETAIAMTEATLESVAASEFLTYMERGSLAEGFLRYLALRVSEQQQLITHLLTEYSEHRLGHILLLLARNIGKPDRCCTYIEQKISHEELSEMVGTTRPRVSKFMRRFRELGLIGVNRERQIIIHEKRLADYLSKNAPPRRPDAGKFSRVSNLEQR